MRTRVGKGIRQPTAVRPKLVRFLFGTAKTAAKNPNKSLTTAFWQLPNGSLTCRNPLSRKGLYDFRGWHSVRYK